MPKPAELKTDALPVACFAPPLTDDLLARYAALAEALPPGRHDVRDAMRECLAAVKLWWELPESGGSRDDASLKILHRGKDSRVKVTSLTPDLIEKLWDAVPWDYEVESMKALFRAVPDADAELKSACHHLLWHAAELCLDREPLTLDKLPQP